MSTWVGGNTGDPNSPTSTRCIAQFCTAFVPQRLHNEGIHLCHEHSLLVWAVVNEQIAAGQASEPEPAPTASGPILPTDFAVTPASPFTVEPRTEPHGVVYYIRTGGRIKIGHSTNIARRLAQYPPDTIVLYVRSGNKDLERSEHQRFRAFLADGREWFQDRPEVTELIHAMATNDAGWTRLPRR